MKDQTKGDAMKRITTVALLSCMIVFLFFTGAPAAEKELRVVGSWSSLTMFKNFEKPFWKQILPEATGGRFKISMTSLGQVKLKGPAVLRQMGVGVFDVVHTVADYVVADSPALAGLDLPALAPDIEKARKVTEAYKPVLAEYLKKDFNAHLLSVAPYPAQVLFCREEITGLSDLKGKKIRASGWTTSEFVTALDATGVTISFGEVPQSLQRGVVDCAITGSLSGFMAGWGDVADYVYPLPMGGWDHVIGSMRLDTWESLSQEDRTTIENLILEKLEKPAWKVTETETQQGLDCLTGGECPHGEAADLKSVPISPGDLTKAREILINDVLPAWSAKVDKTVVKKWNETVGEVVGLTAK
jgi:TRAP-type C4-dicarboxylate transport system substrate-binding protein